MVELRRRSIRSNAVSSYSRKIQVIEIDDDEDTEPTQKVNSSSPLKKTRNSSSQYKEKEMKQSKPQPPKRFKLSDLSQLKGTVKVRSETQNESQSQTQLDKELQVSGSQTLSHRPALKRQSTSHSSSTASLTDENNISTLWQDLYQPQTVAQVALHNRKLKDIKEQLLPMLDRSKNTYSAPRILVFSGPSGCSKSTIAKALAQELIPNPSTKNSNWTSYIEFINPIHAKMDDFEEFLTSAKYLTGNSKKLILVEDLPNVYHDDTRMRFQRALLNWCHSPSLDLPPLIICLTECEIISGDEEQEKNYGVDSTFSAETVLGMTLLQHCRVKRIKFNPVNFTLCKKFLNEIVMKESTIFRSINVTKTKAKVEELARSGDIRSAINALQFWSTYNMSSQVTISSTDTDLKFGKEQPVNLFHAVGKILYGSKKYDETDVDSINAVTEQFSGKGSLLKLGLLENYTKSISMNLRTACDISSFLSWQDQINCDNLSLDLCCRSIRHYMAKNYIMESSSTSSLSTRASCVSSVASFPRDFKSLRAQKQTKQDLKQYQSLELKRRRVSRSFQDSNLFFGFYEPIITKARQFKDRAYISYLRSSKQVIPLDLLLQEQGKVGKSITERLGGPFVEIHADDTSGDDDNRSIYFNKSQYNTDYYRLTPQDDGFSDNEEGDVDILEDDPIEDMDDGDDPGEISLMKDLDSEEEFDRELIALTQRPSKSLEQKAKELQNVKLWKEREERLKENKDRLNFLDDIDFDDDDDW